jgi:hypothetical protein
MNTPTRLAACGALAGLLTAGLLSAPAAQAGTLHGDAAHARAATAAYHDSSVITGSADWFQLYDLQGITCIDNPAGGMGIHFVNGARLGDARENAAEPEAVIYEPRADGSLRLVALEYVVTVTDWVKAGNSGRPHLYGQEFEFVPAGNRYGLPDFYELHAWICRHNPAVMNEDWNSKVSCAHAAATAGG